MCDDDGNHKPEFRIWGPKKSNIDSAVNKIERIIQENKDMIHSSVEVPEKLWGLLFGTNRKNMSALEETNQVFIASPHDLDEDAKTESKPSTA